MYPLILLVGLATSFASAFQLQAVSFAPRLSLYTIHKFEGKRRVLRSIAGVCLILLIVFHRHETGAVVAVVVFSFLLVLSFLIDNTKGFRDLNEEHIVNSADAALDGDTIVVGVALPGEGSVCYAIEDTVVPRHLLNDRLGDTPLLVSFCAACRSCIVYHPVIDGRRLSFQVIAVWRRNMVMRDRETGTLWQQATGEAIYGELKGKKLQMVMSQQMRLDHWRSAHPDTVIAVESETAPKGRIPKPMLKRMLKITERVMARGFSDIGDALPLREKVFGVTVNGVSKAYPISRLKASPEFLDSVGGTAVRIVYRPETNNIDGVNLTDGSPLILESHWWFGWKEFHPFTEVWSGAGSHVQTIDQSTFLKAVGTLMREAYIGPDNPDGPWFADTEAGCGIVGMLERVDAERASRVIGYPEGAGIASHANHIRFALNLVNRAIRGEDVNARADWSSSWSTVTVSDTEWRELKDAIKSEFDTMIATLARGPHWRDPMVLTATIGVIAHGAWHLGAIRQLVAISARR